MRDKTRQAESRGKNPVKTVSRAILAIAALWPPLGAAAAEAVSLRWQKPIEFAGPRRDEELMAVPLDADVYASTQNGFADVRVRDAAGNIVPFLVRKQTETRPQTTRRTWAARDASLKPLDDGSLEITVGLDKEDPQPTGLSVISPLQNFSQQVQVFAAEAPAAQPPLAEGVIFDYSQYMDVREHDVRLPPGSQRRFRVVISPVRADQKSQILELTRRLRGGQEEERTERELVARRPFRIDRLEFWRETTQPAVKGEVKQPYGVAGFTARNDDEHRQTVIDVASRREPLVEFRIETPSRNFSRAARVEVRETDGIRTVWRPIGQATLSRFEFRDLRREQLKIGFPEQRSAAYRIVLENRDSPPLEIASVQAQGHVYRLLLLAAPGGDYRVDYGSQDAKPPDYDTAVVRAALERGIEPVAAALGPEAAGADRVERPLNFQRLINNPIALGSLVVVLVVALGWGLYRAARRVDGLGDETPSPPPPPPGGSA
jgi:hypothetical protein